MPAARCPICHRLFDTDQTEAMPFCSERCQQIDLGRWLGEVYRVPGQENAPWPEPEGQEGEDR